MCIWPNCDSFPSHNKHLCLVHFSAYNKIHDTITKHPSHVRAKALLSEAMRANGGIVILPSGYKSRENN